MKTIGFLLFIVVATVTTTHAQYQKKNINTKVVKVKSSGDEKMLNPQPLPPKADKSGNERSIIIVSGLPEKKAQNSGNEKILNPQPLPPKADKSVKVQSSGNEKKLNPQPLPSKSNIVH
jgi:hypothetical protein